MVNQGLTYTQVYTSCGKLHPTDHMQTAVFFLNVPPNFMRELKSIKIYTSNLKKIVDKILIDRL